MQNCCLFSAQSIGNIFECHIVYEFQVKNIDSRLVGQGFVSLNRLLVLWSMIFKLTEFPVEDINVFWVSIFLYLFTRCIKMYIISKLLLVKIILENRQFSNAGSGNSGDQEFVCVVISLYDPVCSDYKIWRWWWCL